MNPLEIITSDSNDPDGIFNLAQARNNAVRQASGNVIVVADCDTIPPIDSVKRAVADPVGVTWPHTTWRLIPAEYAQRPFTDFPSAPAVIEYPNGLGGVMVTTRDEYWRIGGQPEEFGIGWGCEDSAFHQVVLALSTFRRMPGIAYSIDHNLPDGTADSPGWSRNGPQRQRNLELLKVYQCAGGRAWLMKKIIATREERMPKRLPPENDPLAGRYKG